MNEQKRMDRPKLREKINTILNQYIIRNLAESIMIDDDWITDQILALIEPLIEQTIKDDADRCAGYREGWVEEAKREERERIIYELEQRAVDNFGKCVYWSDLQALKEGK